MFSSKSSRATFISLTITAIMSFILTSCSPVSAPTAASTLTPAPTAQPTAAPMVTAAATKPPTSAPTRTAAPTARPTAAPAKQADEGLVISNFEDDISIWQGYSQDTETVLAAGATPPQGYINVGKYHAKYTDRWVKPTEGLAKNTNAEYVKVGKQSGKWANTVDNNRVVAVNIPHDWSKCKYLAFWAYSETANKAAIELAIYSEPEPAPQDNYYKMEIVVDWTGWRLFEISLKEFAANRNPVGWDKIDYIKIASTGWSHAPNPSTVLYFDAMKLSNVRTGPLLAVELPAEINHPNLMLNEADLAEIKKKIEKYDWAKTAYQTVSANAFVWSTRTIAVPKTGGGYYHAGGADYAITQTHYDHADAARDLALAFQISGERKYADKAKEILLAYTQTYLTYEIHDSNGRTGDRASAGGRATAQAINEAAWVIPLTWAYDLIYHMLTPDERERIETELLRPAADLIMSNNEGRHNHQTWYNAGVGVIGLALGEKEYVWYALYKPESGFYSQMKKSITPDGAWYEGAPHYQFYVMQAMWPLSEAAFHAGINLYQEPEFKALFDFPMRYADTTLRLPVINDGRVVYLDANDRSRYYEIALARFNDPRYVTALQASDRTSFEALAFGVSLQSLPQPVAWPWDSLNLERTGLAILRSGQGSTAKQAVLNYMGYEGGHSHLDKLGLVLFGAGRTVAPDAGSIKYEDPVHTGWYKQSLSHNVLVVDEKTQLRAPMGTLELFLNSPPLKVARVSTPRIYTGVTQIRTLLLNDDYLVDIFQADSAAEHTYDWVYHNYGQFSSDLSLQPVTTPAASAKGSGYEYLSNVKSAATDLAWSADWLIASDQKVKLNMLGTPGTTVLAAEGMVAAPTNDETSTEKVPLVIARRKAKSASFVSLIEPCAKQPAITKLATVEAVAADGKSVSTQDATGLQISRGGSTDLLMLSKTKGDKRFGDYVLDGAVGWVSSAGDAIKWLYLGAGNRLAGKTWSVDVESMGTGNVLGRLGVYVEIGPKRLLLQSASPDVTILTLKGFLSGALQAFKLDENGSRVEIKPIESGEQTIRFFFDSQATYEIVGQ